MFKPIASHVRLAGHILGTLNDISALQRDVPNVATPFFPMLPRRHAIWSISPDGTAFRSGETLGRFTVIMYVHKSILHPSRSV